MNIAVLFDTSSDSGIGANTLLAGKKLYSYSLKVFYLHPMIDSIVLILFEQKSVVHAEKYIENIRKKYGIEKQVRMENGIIDLQYIKLLFSDKFENVFKEECGEAASLCVLHDIRYPFVTTAMIDRIIENAALYGIAVTTGDIKESLAVRTGQEVLEGKSYQYAKYPVAFQAGYKIIDNLADMVNGSEKCLEDGACLCNTEVWNPFIYNEELLETAEAVLCIRLKGLDLM